LENEHLNNVGNYRAVKEVPLPFGEIDSDGWTLSWTHVQMSLTSWPREAWDRKRVPHFKITKCAVTQSIHYISNSKCEF